MALVHGGGAACTLGDALVGKTEQDPDVADGEPGIHQSPNHMIQRSLSMPLGRCSRAPRLSHLLQLGLPLVRKHRHDLDIEGRRWDIESDSCPHPGWCWRTKNGQ